MSTLRSKTLTKSALMPLVRGSQLLANSLTILRIQALQALQEKQG
jgi:hypothetical protein